MTYPLCYRRTKMDGLITMNFTRAAPTSSPYPWWRPACTSASWMVCGTCLFSSTHHSFPFILITDDKKHKAHFWFLWQIFSFLLCAVDEPCQLGCSGLSYCTNFNHRPTELFQSCTREADYAAEKAFKMWESGPIILPQMEIHVKGARPSCGMISMIWWDTISNSQFTELTTND